MSDRDAYYRRLMVGESQAADGTQPYGRATRTFEQAMSQVHGRYYEQARRGNIQWANAIVTAPVIFSTEAGTGGPLLYNPSSTHVANVLAVGWGITTVSTVAGSLGLTGGYGQTSSPTSTTAIDSESNGLIASTTGSKMEVYRVGTTGTNRFFFPFASINTGALTTIPGQMNWVNLDGLFCLPQNTFISVAGSATLSTLVVNVCLVWEEVPV